MSTLTITHLWHFYLLITAIYLKNDFLINHKRFHFVIKNVY